MDIIKVFISSVFDESFKYGFKDERISLKERINASGDNCFTDISLDYEEPDSDKGSLEKSIERINNADIIVLFIGTKYGTIREKIRKSLTHEEYLKAVEEDKKILIYKFPVDICHPEYEKSKGFLEDIYNNDRQIVSSISDRLKGKFLDIIDYKKGKNTELDEKLKSFYLTELSSIIYNDLQKAKESLLYLPKGVEKFEEDEIKESKLKVEYVKRSVYKELYNLSDDFLSEIDMFNKIFNEDKLGILIYGEGGIGKTRLSKELALMAKNNEWQVLTINSKCDDLDNIKYKTNSNYCLFFDYIETQMFSKEEIEKHIKRHSNKNKIRVILNSRNTYVNIDDYRDDNKFIDLNISSMNNEIPNEKNYVNFVIEKMFEQKGISKKDIQLSLVQKPSFAIFMLETGGRIEDLKTINFREYLKRFLEKSFEHKTFNKIESIYFHILANLPLNKEIRKDYKDEIDILKKEKLIELDNNEETYKASFNDTIIDELLIIYLTKFTFDDKENFEAEIEKVFNFSIEKNTFNNIINSFGKISSDEKIKNRRGVFRKELTKDKYKELITNSIIVFKKSSILNELDKLDIRMKHDNISITSKEFAFGLSRAINEILTINDDFRAFKKIFNIWIQNNNENSLKFLCQDVNASFIICAIYDYYIKDKEIENFNINFYAERYLENLVDKENCGFVIQKYLDNNGSIEKVEDSIIKYIELFSDKENCRYTFQKYLDNNGSIEKIEDSIIKYIELFSDKENCSYTIQKYLDNDGDIKKIEDSLIKYINLFSDKENCSFAIQKYLDNSGNIERIEDSLIEYVNLFCDKEKSGYIIQKYLNYCNNIKRIEDSLIKYIYMFYDNEKCTYIMQNLDKNNYLELLFSKVDNIAFFISYLNYLIRFENYTSLDKYKIYINNFVRTYDFDIKNNDLESYILIVVWIQNKNNEIFTSDIQDKISEEIINYKRKVSLTKNYLIILGIYLQKVKEIRKSIIFEIITEKIYYSIKETKFLDDYYNLLELINFVDKYFIYIQNDYIKNEILKKIFLFLRNEKFLHEMQKDLSSVDYIKSTEKVMDFLKYDLKKDDTNNVIIIKFINSLSISNIVKDKLTVYFPLFKYIINKNPELINNNILNIRDKYLEFLELSRSFSKTKKNRLRGIYSERFTNEEISNLIFKIIKENSENTFIIQIIIKFILAKNDFSLLKEDIEKFVKKNSKEAFDKFYDDDIEILKSLKLFVESI